MTRFQILAQDKNGVLECCLCGLKSTTVELMNEHLANGHQVSGELAVCIWRKQTDKDKED